MLMITGAALAVCSGVMLFFYFRPPQITPLSDGAMRRIKYLDGIQGDINV
jgi:hypothetical protein